jgi:hypothetical protein
LTVDGWRDGGLPESLPGADVVRTPLIEVSGDVALMTIPGVARFGVPTRGAVIVERDPSAGRADVECFLSGPVTALQRLLQGTFCLRAATVAVGQQAIALCGPSAIGKSTLAATLALRGHRILGDKVLPVRPESSGARVQYLRSTVELWPPAAANLGLDEAAGKMVRPSLAKRSFDIQPDRPEGDDRTRRDARLSLIVCLGEDSRILRPQVGRLERGVERFRRLERCTWHATLVEAMGLSLDHLDWLATIVDEVPVLRMTRPSGVWAQVDLANEIEAALP